MELWAKEIGSVLVGSTSAEHDICFCFYILFQLAKLVFFQVSICPPPPRKRHAKRPTIPGPNRCIMVNGPSILSYLVFWQCLFQLVSNDCTILIESLALLVSCNSIPRSQLFSGCAAIISRGFGVGRFHRLGHPSCFLDSYCIARLSASCADLFTDPLIMAVLL